MVAKRGLEQVLGLLQDVERSMEDTLVSKTIQEWFLLANHISNQILYL